MEKIIFWETKEWKIDYIYKLGADFIVLYANRNVDGVWSRQLIRIDYDGNILSYDESWLEPYIQVGEYLVCSTGKKVIYCTWYDKNWTTMLEFTEQQNW